jgi:hypothetical protein
MIIAAKFAAACGRCSKAIAIGSKVEWAPGTRAAHVACVAVAGPAPRVSRRRGCGYPGCTGGLSHCDECSD